MDRGYQPECGLPTTNGLNEQELLDEIAYLTSRLAAMGSSGDCAYERALARAFSSLVQERTRLLSQLRSRV